MSDPDGWSRQIPGWVSPQGAPLGYSANTFPSGSSSATAKKRRWWGWALALFLVAVVVTTSCVWFVIHDRNSTNAVAEVFGTPESLFLSERMDRQPVPGWSLKIADAISADVESIALIGSYGDTAVFKSYDRQDAVPPMTRVFAVNVVRGELLSAALALPKTDDCWLNGPPVVLCISGTSPTSGAPDPQAWVIDTSTGQMLHTGPTDMRFLSSKRKVKQVGQYAVEAVNDVGVYGIGRSAEHTWFVAGEGIISAGGGFSPDVPPPVLTDQDAQSEIVFSVVDGRVKTPTPRVPGDRSSKAQSSTTGMAVLMKAENGSNYVTVIDNDGSVTGTFNPQVSGGAVDLDISSRETPIVRIGTADSSRWIPISSTGRALLTIPSESLTTEFRTIGHRLLVAPQSISGGTNDTWYQYDLRSGQKLSTCVVPYLVSSHGASAAQSSYVGFDGTTVVTSAGKAVATNLDTCNQQQWEFGWDSNFSKVNRTLVKYDRDTISSLVAPK
ncbi:hypothetical protein [Mycobacteroides chelonae]|uniref:hypothetical protein n=1 Tax=Mycobacteroides chelonae TaxID=1774 RepID=UPI0012FF9831|nr:hypothetical protein [Mycobacteroides chelonae]